MKFALWEDNLGPTLSLPLVGVWIEIQKTSYKIKLDGSHSPWWECGLKFQNQEKEYNHQKSLPLVGVWIEIYSPPLGAAQTRVTPLGGSVD